MNWFHLVDLILFLLICQSSVTPTSQTTLAPVSQDEDCPTTCVLVSHNNESTSENNGLVMTSRELNPDYYEARRAGNAVQHYINTLYGSPFRLYTVTRVHKARTEDMGEEGMKYHLEISVNNTISGSSEERCTAEILYPRTETEHPPQVQGSWDGLSKVSSSATEEDFYKRYSAADSAVSGKDIPDSYGHIDPEMKPFWHLAWAASSFVMLNKSSENTLYNMAQVAKITQLESQDDQLRFEYQVLLHDMVSQGIYRWKMQVSWSPAGGVKVSDTEFLPRCHCNSTQ